MNKIIKAIALDNKVRILGCDIRQLCNQAALQHDLWPTSLAALGRIMAVGAMMGADLKKDEEKIVLNINGHGPIGTCLVEAYGNGDLRGFVGDNKIYLKYNDSNKLAVGAAVGKDGYLQVIKDLKLKDTFTGKVQLQSGEIGDDFAYYFMVSEQTPSVVSVGVLVDTDNLCKAAGGLIIQLLPEATENEIQQVEQLLKTLRPISELLAEEQTIETIVENLFADVKILGEKEVRWHCDCSKQRFTDALKTVATEDLQQMIDEDQGCEVKCEFCNTKYQFSASELEEIIRYRQSCGK